MHIWQIIVDRNKQTDREVRIKQMQTDKEFKIEHMQT